MSGRRFQSKTEATEAWRKDYKAVRESHQQAVADYLNGARANVAAALTASEPAAKALFEAISLHTPSHTSPTSEPYCPECSGCCDSEDWPCDTFSHLAAAVSLADPPEGPGYEDYPRFEDYWTDPYVTVTLAHLTKVKPADETEARFFAPQQQVTVTLAEAQRIKPRLIHSSMRRVDALS